MIPRTVTGWSVVLLLLLALVPSLPALDTGEAALMSPVGEVRPSILIDGDDAFTPENGVRGGSGTAEDPYVISGWTVVADRAFGIRVLNTTKHLVIRDVWVAVSGHWPGFVRDCELGRRECPRIEGIGLHEVANASLQRVTIERPNPLLMGAGLLVKDSQRIETQDLLVTSVVPVPLEAVSWDFFGYGISIRGSFEIDVRNATVERTPIALSIRDSSRVTFTDSFFDGRVSAFDVLPVSSSDNVSFVGSRFMRASPSFQGSLQDIHLIGNDVTGRRGVFISYYSGETLLERLFVCGNTLTHVRARDYHHSPFPALWVQNTRDALVVGNFFDDNDKGLRISMSTGVRVERNLITNSSAPGTYDGTAIDHTGPVAEIHHNTFVNNQKGVYTSGDANLTHNWWGDPSGPSGLGNGTGDRLWSYNDRPVAFEPWLTEPPAVGPEAVDCDAKLAAWRAGRA